MRAMTGRVSLCCLADAGRLEEILARHGLVFLDDLELDHRRDVVGRMSWAILHHLQRSSTQRPSKTVGWALPVRYSWSDSCEVLVRAAKDHLQRRHQQARLDELLLHLGPKRRQREGNGLHERLIGAGRTLRGEQVGRVGRIEIAIAVAAAVVAGVVIAMFGIDVDVVVRVMACRESPAPRRAVIAADVAAAVRRRRRRGRVAERRRAAACAAGAPSRDACLDVGLGVDETLASCG